MAQSAPGSASTPCVEGAGNLLLNDGVKRLAAATRANLFEDL